MLLSPVQNRALFTAAWVQRRPRISQEFGKTKWAYLYERFGMEGHNGYDVACPVGTPIFSPMDGFVQVKPGSKPGVGYGKHIKIRNPWKPTPCEVVLGHLSEFEVVDGQQVQMGDLLGYSGNTGFSSGPHLHTGFRLLKEPGRKTDLFKWKVLDYKNGYLGYINPVPFIINWKGTHVRNTL